MKNTILPPKFLNGLLVVAIGLHFIIPIRQIFPTFSIIGFMFILLGISLNIWSILVLKENNTTIDFDKKPNRLVTKGPFSIGRNPIYLSGVILSLGISISLGSLITFPFPLALLMILNKYYIPLEEMKLEKIFGEEYRKYKQKVRRWI
jgi:protein-S-isoprenylcysteine O-methyltransferase Ste14